MFGSGSIQVIHKALPDRLPEPSGEVVGTEGHMSRCIRQFKWLLIVAHDIGSGPDHPALLVVIAVQAGEKWSVKAFRKGFRSYRAVVPGRRDVGGQDQDPLEPEVGW